MKKGMIGNFKKVSSKLDDLIELRNMFMSTDDFEVFMNKFNEVYVKRQFLAERIEEKANGVQFMLHLKDSSGMYYQGWLDAFVFVKKSLGVDG